MHCAIIHILLQVFIARDNFFSRQSIANVHISFESKMHEMWYKPEKNREKSKNVSKRMYFHDDVDNV